MKDAEPEVRQPVAQDATQPRRPGCFLRGTRLATIVMCAAHAGLFAAGAVLLATPLGMVLAGGVCLFCLASALESSLWPRSRLSNVLAAVFGCLALVVCAILFLEDTLQVIGGCAIAALLALLMYLVFRRRRPRRWQFEPLRVRAALGLIGTGLLIGVAVGLFFCLDEAPEAFPGLEVRPPAADDDNGFVVLSDVMKALPEPEWDDLAPLVREPPDGLPRGSAEWKEKALDVLARYKGVLAAADDVLAKRRFVTPLPRTYAEWEQMLCSGWSSYCRRMRELLLVKSQLLLLEGDSAGAMDAADKVVRLGRLVVRDSGNVIDFLVGSGKMQAGMAAVRDAAASPPATSRLVSSQHAALDAAGDLRMGFAHALAGDMVGQRLSFIALGSLELLEDSDGEVDDRLVRSLRALLREPGRPYLKLNMTMNELGARTERMLNGIDRYQPLPPDEPVFGLRGLARQVGWHRATRNFAGQLVAMLSSRATEPMVAEYFRAQAHTSLTRTFLALRCYQIEHGRLPETLDELAPAYIESVPLDPFTEAPFVYEPSGEPPRILSVGPDQKPDPPDAEDKDDIVVELTFPGP